MHNFKAPIRDIQFTLYEVLGAEQHYQRIGAQEANRELVDAIIVEGGKFAEEVLAPLNQIGDTVGCQFNNGVVTTPPGFKEAYKQYVEGGWPSLAGEAAYGKQCVACHVVVNDDGEKLAGRNGKSGPNLYNIAGAGAGMVEDYRYGKSIVAAGAKNGLIWTEETFVAYVQDPKGFLRSFLDDKKARAKMSFKVRNEDDARNIYAYLFSLADE